MRIIKIMFLFFAATSFLYSCAPKATETVTTGSPLPTVDVKCGNNSCL